MNIEDLQETAQLAHLTMGERELSAAFPAFEQMLGFFAAMQSADKDFAPASGETGDFRGIGVSAGHFRQDAADARSAAIRVQGNLLDNAGELDGNFVAVPNVL
ncbi:MAG: aspartyl/glutamyl-tRNA amidotransferase subunit C [Spirochaetaceae bacterium]|jgi:aspartyl-tRNA(Asn)/glutamyl-tRNA(Gln) amidotransferase subunit C|nr:aspartyl/glutamyl-tRNA amidotransferase subunit C [Spirochaetaceae bacterium]